MFRGSVKGIGYLIRSPVSPSLPLPASQCAITFQLDPTNTFKMIRFYVLLTHCTSVFYSNSEKTAVITVYSIKRFDFISYRQRSLFGTD